MRVQRLAFAVVASCLPLWGGCGGGGHHGPRTPAWAGFGGDPTHAARSPASAQTLSAIHWSRPVDLDPQYTGDVLYIHYGSPLVTRANTVIFPVKTGATGGFRFDAVRGATGVDVWSFSTDYLLPPHDWVPSVGGCLTPTHRLYVPAAGGTLLFRDDPDLPGDSPSGRVAFFGDALYAANAAAFNAAVFVNTPLTSDADGNVFFGVQVTGANPGSLVGSLVRLTPEGSATVVPIPTHSAGMTKVQHGSAPALSPDGATVYVTVDATDGTGGSDGYLVAASASDLSFVAQVHLVDPKSAGNALVYDSSTASPTVGPDGDVYVGVLENPFPSNHARGWLLHFDATLSTEKLPAAFGWDDTASIVPSSMVPGYAGPSDYLLTIKYNNYAEAGGDGVNRLAIVDPNDGAIESVSGILTMKEIRTVAGVTPDADFLPTFPNAVREWCVNTAAVDPTTRSILVNSEDGTLYRWNLVTNALEEPVVLAPPTGEAYTPTVVGPDGTVYAVNNAILNAVGR